jgi:hypothetical protein
MSEQPLCDSASITVWLDAHTHDKDLFIGPWGLDFGILPRFEDSFDLSTQVVNFSNVCALVHEWDFHFIVAGGLTLHFEAGLQLGARWLQTQASDLV